MDRFIGKRLDGRYEISELIGIGGMAVVYKAYDTIDERVVAIKILKEEFLANDEFRRRFKNEAKAIAVLSHPNIVKVFEVSFGDVLQYIVMEYCSGITLKEYVKQKGIIDWEEATFFTAQILKALQHAHEKGIVHRDIKPQNIILMEDGSIKVTDFGIARFSRSEQKTITDKAIGSVHYISPEQARGDSTDGKSDIYSVGVLLYEMTTGKLPFQADSAVSVAIMQLQNEPVHPCDINNLLPKGLEQIILNAMQKEPMDRYPTAFDMLQDIEEIRRDPYAHFEHTYSEAPKKAPIPIANNDAYEFVESPRREPSYTKNPVQKKEKKSKVIPVLTAIAAVFVIALVAIVCYVFFGGTGSTVKCPDFIGKDYEKIIADSQYSNFTFEKVEESYNADYDKGEVYKQSPSADEDVKENANIKLYVSKGSEELKVPDCEKLEYTEAKAILEENGFIVRKTEINDDDVTKDCVVKSVPPAGEVVSAGDEITLYVSLGPEQIEVSVPDVKGMYVDNAKQALVDKGLRVGDTIYVSDDTAYGVVVSQYPRSGETAVLDDEVTIYVSKGYVEQTTPSVAATNPVTEIITEAETTEAPQEQTVAETTQKTNKTKKSS